MRRSLFSRLNEKIFKAINRKTPWHRLPTPISILNLLALRDELRAENLYDTSGDPMAPDDPSAVPEEVLHIRTIDGQYNDLHNHDMGKGGTRFGRNMPIAATEPDPEPALLTPNPRTISQKILKRESFQPASTLNVLAAAWIQFQTHDWFNHGENRTDDHFELPIEEGDSWHENPMRIERTMADPTRQPGEADRPPTYINPATHWWDASGIYGSTEEITQTLRTFEDGRMKIEDGRLPIDTSKNISLTGFNDNWWVGLDLLHTLFTLEHNAICDTLRAAYPAWTDQQLFDKARLINGTLIAKLHTVEWTPGILGHPALQIGMRANWWGLIGERVHRLFGRRLSMGEALTGIPTSGVDHHGVPYYLTEEFSAVYRLHPLLPDDHIFYSATTGETLQQFTLPQVSFDQAAGITRNGVSMLDAFYSYGVDHPGAITLHNYPKFLCDLKMPGKPPMDLGAVDIIRDRERGIPRYNKFRELLHKPRISSFDEMLDDDQWQEKGWVEEMRSLYDNDVNRIDTMVGMFSETPPNGFGFSDTAFRVFILMASRRLKSDRFIADYYTPQTYTPEGFDWVEKNMMSDVLLRHYPELRPALDGVKNAFAPWNRVV